MQKQTEQSEKGGEIPQHLQHVSSEMRIQAVEMLMVVKDYIAEKRSHNTARVPIDTATNVHWLKMDEESWLDWVRHCIAYFEEVAERTKTGNNQLLQQAKPHIKKALTWGEKKRNLLALDELIHWAQHVDKNLAETLLRGVRTVGNSEESGVWALDPTIRPIDEQELQDYIDASIVIEKAEPKHWDTRLLRGLYDEMLKMLHLGLYERVAAGEKLKVQPSMAFPKDEIVKIRQIIDARGQNLYSRLLEKMQLHGTRSIQELINMCQAPVGLEHQGMRMPDSITAKETHAEAEQIRQKAAATLKKKPVEEDPEWIEAKQWAEEEDILEFKHQGQVYVRVNAHIANGEWIPRELYQEKYERRAKNGQLQRHYTQPQREAVRTANKTAKLAEDMQTDPDPKRREAIIEEVRRYNEEARKAIQTMGGFCPEMVSRDFEKYYYLFGVEDPDLNVTDFFNPDTRMWEAVKSIVLNMGNAHSVPGACRVSEAVRTIYAYAGGVAIIYIDDSFLFASNPKTMYWARRLCDALAAALGLPLSKKPAGNQCSCDVLADGNYRDHVRGLGIRYIWCRPNRTIYAAVPRDVIEKCKERIRLVLQQEQERNLRRKDIQRLLGVANYIVQHTTRAGAEFLRAIYPWAGEDQFGELKRERSSRNTLRRALITLEQIVPKLPPIRLLWEPKLINFLWLDASTDGMGSREVKIGNKTQTWSRPMIGGILINWQGEVKSFSIELDTTDLGRELDIQVLESLTVAFAQRAFANDMEGANNLTNVDNMCELYALVKLSTRQPSVAAVATWVAAECLRTRSSNYYRYCNTKFNPGDAFSRKDLLPPALQFWQPKTHYTNITSGMPMNRIPNTNVVDVKHFLHNILNRFKPEFHTKPDGVFCGDHPQKPWCLPPSAIPREPRIEELMIADTENEEKLGGGVAQLNSQGSEHKFFTHAHAKHLWQNPSTTYGEVVMAMAIRTYFNNPPMRNAYWMAWRGLAEQWLRHGKQIGCKTNTLEEVFQKTNTTDPWIQIWDAWDLSESPYRANTDQTPSAQSTGQEAVAEPNPKRHRKESESRRGSDDPEAQNLLQVYEGLPGGPALTDPALAELMKRMPPKTRVYHVVVLTLLYRHGALTLSNRDGVASLGPAGHA